MPGGNRTVTVTECVGGKGSPSGHERGLSELPLFL